jgi:hypothetical protein
MAFTKADKVQFRINSLPFGTDWIPGINGYRAAQNPKAKAAALASYAREIEEITWALADDMGFADDLKTLYELEALAELEAE